MQFCWSLICDNGLSIWHHKDVIDDGDFWIIDTHANLIVVKASEENKKKHAFLGNFLSGEQPSVVSRALFLQNDLFLWTHLVQITAWYIIRSHIASDILF